MTEDNPNDNLKEKHEAAISSFPDPLPEDLAMTKEGYEQGTMEPVTIIYRDNSLFREYIPVVREHLEALGGRVQIVPFPRGTSRSYGLNIRSWYGRSAAGIRNRFVLTDNTCFPKSFDGVASAQSLDAILEGSFINALRASPWSNLLKKDEGMQGDWWTVESIGKVLPVFFKLLLVHDNPKEVIIIKSHLSDHVKGVTALDFEIKLEGYLQSAGFEGKITAQDQLEFNVEGFEDKTPGQDKPFSNQDAKDTWILVDRHVEFLEDVAMNYAKVLVLPLANLMRSAMNEGLLPDSLNDYVKEDLRRTLTFNYKPKITLDDVKQYLQDHHTSLGPSAIEELMKRAQDEQEAEKILNFLENLKKGTTGG